MKETVLGHDACTREEVAARGGDASYQRRGDQPLFDQALST
jgi:hypothetical protein